MDQNIADGALEQRGSRGPRRCLSTSSLDEKPARRPISQYRNHLKGFHKFDSIERVPRRFRGSRTTFWWCHKIQTTHLYFKIVFRLPPFIRLLILWILQWCFHNTSTKRMHLRYGGIFIFSEWCQTLHTSVRHDRKISGLHPEADASKRRKRGDQVWSSHRFADVDELPLSRRKLC